MVRVGMDCPGSIASRSTLTDPVTPVVLVRS